MERRLGRSELLVSATGLGCWAIGGPFWSSENADVYGGGHSEDVLGPLQTDYIDLYQYHNSGNDKEQAPAWMRFFQDNKPLPEWLDELALARDILQTDGRTLVQGALVWLWGCSQNTIPIPGFKTVQQVEENAKAMQFGPLGQAEMEAITGILGYE